jgi:large subunit ribosomal protein L15
MKLNEIPLPRGRKAKSTKRLGRGDGSGTGGTAGRGHKGQKARAGGYHKVGFEGGQMPLARRLPKRGFTNIFAREYTTINLDQLAKAFPQGGEVTMDLLYERGVVSKRRDGLKILGRGEISTALNVKVSKITESARKKIEAAGGSVEVLGG